VLFILQRQVLFFPSETEVVYYINCCAGLLLVWDWQGIISVGLGECFGRGANVM
jgi:hypothetical protein